MPRFRSTLAAFPQQRTLEPFAIGQLIDASLEPGHFYVAPELRLRWEPARAVSIPWEFFHSVLLDVAQCREFRTMLAWRIVEQQDPAEEPLISVLYDVTAQQIHVVRGIRYHGWEAFDAGGQIESRETIRWLRECVGSMTLAHFPSLEIIQDELICLIWQAVVGTSRLPLTSLEAPLPAFVLGRLAYVHRTDLSESTKSSTSISELQTRIDAAELCWRERVKLVEVILRAIAPDEIAEFASRFRSYSQAELLRLFRSLFNEISLSPYLRFVDNCLSWIDELVVQQILSVSTQVDFFTRLLTQLGRHLTAYDLVVFHHRGANYPDALLVDAVLKRLLVVVEQHLELFEGTDRIALSRRRGLRQGCLARRQYEGHLVPDVPTSPGENARVMPAEMPRVPEVQLNQMFRRNRQLFAADPLHAQLGPEARSCLQQSGLDLASFDEWRELGLGVFIDRPLGYGKAVGEPDLTPLLAHEAFSPTLASRKFEALQRLARELGITIPEFVHHVSPSLGLSHRILAEPSRPAVAVTDMRRVADDFVILRTLPGGLRTFWQLFDFTSLGSELPRWMVQVTHEAGPRLTCYNDEGQPYLEIVVDPSQGWIQRAGYELPVAGLRVIWQGGVTQVHAVLDLTQSH